MITFTISQRWMRHFNATTEAAFVKRVADVAVGAEQQNENVPYQNTNGNWVLDANNNWILSIKGDQAELKFRYDSPNNINKDQWAALKMVLEWATR